MRRLKAFWKFINTPRIGGHEVMKDTNPKDAIGVKKWRQFMVVPRQVLWEVGVGMLEGALKYGRHNYRAAGVRASVYCDAAMGHIEQFIEGEDLDKDSGLSHVTKAICSLVVLRDAMMNDFWQDDRPPKIKDMDALRDRLQAKVEENFTRWADKNPHHYTHEQDGAPYRPLKWPHGGLPVNELDEQFNALVRKLVESGEARVGSMQGVPADWHQNEVKGDELEIGKVYKVHRLRNGDLVKNGETWRIIDVRKTDGTRLGVKASYPIGHKGTPLSKSHWFVEVKNDWNATEADFADDEILAAASTLRAPVDLGQVAAVKDQLLDPKYLPMDSIPALGKDDPSNWVKDNSTNPSYDREHVVEGLTQAQIDRLVRHEAQRCGVFVSEAPSDSEMWNALCRRVLLRLRTRAQLWHTVDFANGGTDRRFSRLRSEEWFIAIPGCRITPDAINDAVVRMTYHPDEVVHLRKHYNPSDVRTWPYYPIVMPLKDGQGPTSDAECDTITWEVWDLFCNSVGTFGNLPDAINDAMRRNKETLE